MRISDWSSDVCSSDLRREIVRDARVELAIGPPEDRDGAGAVAVDRIEIVVAPVPRRARGEAVFLVEADDVVAPPRQPLERRLQRAAVGVERDEARSLRIDIVIGRASCRARVWKYG